MPKPILSAQTISGIMEEVRAFVDLAYETGFKDGQKRVRDDLASQLGAYFKDSSEHPEGIPPSQFVDDYREGPEKIASMVGRSEGKSSATAVGRAKRGSVEPRVLGALKGVKGKKPGEIAEETGIPENSVRGMLNRLKGGRVFKLKNVWRLKGPQIQPDGSTIEVTPSGQIINTPAQLVKKNGLDMFQSRPS